MGGSTTFTIFQLLLGQCTVRPPIDNILFLHRFLSCDSSDCCIGLPSKSLIKPLNQHGYKLSLQTCVSLRLKEYPCSRLELLLTLSTAISAAGKTLLDSNPSPSQKELTNNSHSGVVALMLAVQYSSNNPTRYLVF